MSDGCTVVIYQWHCTYLEYDDAEQIVLRSHDGVSEVSLVIEQTARQCCILELSASKKYRLASFLNM